MKSVSCAVSIMILVFRVSGLSQDAVEEIPDTMFNQFVTDQCPEISEIVSLLETGEEKREIRRWATSLFFDYNERAEHYGETAARLWLKRIALEHLCQRLASAVVKGKETSDLKAKLTDAVTRWEKTEVEWNVHRIAELKEELAVREARLTETSEQRNNRIKARLEDLLENASGQ